MGLGQIIQGWNLHDRYSTEFKNGFNGLFSLGYDSIDGQISWKDAVKAGWTFAKAIALDTNPVLLKAFESQTWGMFRGMMVKDNMTISGEQADALKGAIETFSWNYVRLRPQREESWSTWIGIAPNGNSFADLIWNTKWSMKEGQYGIGLISDQNTENGWMGTYAYNYRQNLMDGMNAQRLIQGFDYAQVMLNAAARTVPFYSVQDARSYPSRDGGTLRELIEIGFEMSRVGATNPTGAATNPSAGLEAVMEGNAKLAGEGLSQFVAPFKPETSYDEAYYGTTCRSVLDYAQRLMRAAAGVQDAGLRGQVSRSDTLSELVNLGGAYAALDPSKGQSMYSDLNKMFLKTLWGDSLHQNALIWASEQLESIILPFNTPASFKEAIQYERNV